MPWQFIYFDVDIPFHLSRNQNPGRESKVMRLVPVEVVVGTRLPNKGRSGKCIYMQIIATREQKKKGQSHQQGTKLYHRIVIYAKLVKIQVNLKVGNKTTQ
jgi:hypothetical protein